MRLKKVLCALGVGLFFTAAASAEKSDDELLIKARGGDVSSQLKLADEYFFGRGKRKADSRLAAYWFRKAAERHDAKAQFNYGVCCLKGWGVPASAQTGYLWISRAAEQNLEAAQIMQAELLFSGIAPELDSHRRFPAISADPQKSIDVLTKLFENGSASAAKTLAKLLLSDASMRKKYPFLLRKSSKFSAEKMAWDVESVLVYSTVLQNGIGGEVDNKTTLALLRSIENRSPEAMARLADMYEYGLSVPPDPEKALELCRRAAVNGSPRAIHAMGTRYLEANAVEHSPEKAFKLFEQAWKAQYPAASASLGKCYLGGIGTMKDENRAFELFMQGAAAGDPESQYQLGLCFLNGIGTAGDAAGAVHWFKAASSAGLPDAMRELGKSLVRGVGTKKNIQYGRQLLEEAVKLGDIQAAEFLRGEVSQ